MTGWYFVGVMVVDSTYLFMFFGAELNNEVRLPLWFPVDLRASGGLGYFIYCCVPVSAAYVSGIHHILFDTMILTFSLVLGAKIDNLALLLRTLEQGGDQEQGRLLRLHDCVRMHQRVIR